MRERAVYIKPMTWAGNLRYYVGLQPSIPTADPCSRLGAYFIQCERRESALAIAQGEAKRLGWPVIECEHYVGF